MYSDESEGVYMGRKEGRESEHMLLAWVVRPHNSSYNIITMAVRLLYYTVLNLQGG